MASRIPDNVVQDVIARVRIEDVVGETVRLQRKGGRLFGLCPFHGEKSPSFSVSPERGFFYCFGCGASGDALRFVMRNEALPFMEALRKLADRAGVTLPEADDVDEGEARRRRDERERYLAATLFARDYFVKQLWNERATEATAHLSKRGVDRATAEQFGLGFAPAGWSGLVDEAGRRGFAMKDLALAGLVAQGQSGHYDRFRNRIMFPVVDLAGRVLAFSGRTLDPNEDAKYVNSPETAYYRKGRELFGLHAAQKAVRTSGTAVLVEGNFDVVSLHARGLTNVCAPLGTAFTEDQARLLRRFTERVVILFDGDNAGRKAARRALEVLLRSEMRDVAFAALPTGADPDSYVREHGADALQALIDRARPMLDVELDAAIGGAIGSTSPTSKQTAAEAVAGLLSHVKSALVRDQYVVDVARRIDVDPVTLANYVRRQPRPSERSFSDEPPPELAEPARNEPVVPLASHEQAVVQALAADPEFALTFHREQLHYLVGDRDLATFLAQFAAARFAGERRELFDFVQHLDDGPFRARLLRALADAPPVEAPLRRESKDARAEVAPSELSAAVRATLKQRWGQGELARMREQVRQAEDAGDIDAALDLLKRIHEMAAWLRREDA